MKDQKIIVLGSKEIVTIFGFLGIKGKNIETHQHFLKEFKKTIKISSIGMVIIALTLPKEIVDNLIDFKLNNKKPFIHYIPDLFQLKKKKLDIIYKKIYNSINRIID